MRQARAVFDDPAAQDNAIIATTTIAISREPRFCVYYAPRTLFIRRHRTSNINALLPDLTSDSEYQFSKPIQVPLNYDEVVNGGIQNLPRRVPGLGQLLQILPDFDEVILSLNIAQTDPERPRNLFLLTGARPNSTAPDHRFLLPGTNILVPAPASWF